MFLLYLLVAWLIGDNIATFILSIKAKVCTDILKQSLLIILELIFTNLIIYFISHENFILAHKTIAMFPFSVLELPSLLIICNIFIIIFSVVNVIFYYKLFNVFYSILFEEKKCEKLSKEISYKLSVNYSYNFFFIMMAKKIDIHNKYYFIILSQLRNNTLFKDTLK